MRLTLKDIVQRTPDVKSFIFEVNQTFEWKPGQYLKLVIQNSNPDSRGVNRFFSISSAPSEKMIMITTRFAGDKSSSFKKDLFDLSVGDEIEATGPYGDFVMPEEINGKKFCFIAGGIGITPLRSILMELASQNTHPDIVLLYANRDENIVFKEELEKLKADNSNLKISYILDPKRVDEETIKTEVPDYKERLFYSSGPEPMVEGIAQILKEMGLPEEWLKHDYFPGYEAI